MKNWLISKTAVLLLNKYLADNGYEGIGRIEHIEFNKADKTITVILALSGEPDPVTATMSEYSFKENEGHCDLNWTSITVSRSWMESAAVKFLPNPIRIPALIGKVLSKIV